MTQRPLKYVFLAAALLALGGSQASAELIYLGTTEQFGVGIGNQYTILSFQSEANGQTANAAIVRSGGADDILSDGNTNINGGANNQTRTFGEAGITDASQFRLVWNLNEPGDGSVTLDALRVAFYGGPTGSDLLHVAVLDLSACGTPGEPPCEYDEVLGGIGGAGHVFGLDPAEIAVMNGFGNQTFADIRVGIGSGDAEFPSYVSLSDETGGFETFSLASAAVTQVPEPTTLMLLGAALMVLTQAVRRRR